MTKYMWFQLVSMFMILGVLIFVVITENTLVETGLQTVNTYYEEINDAYQKNEGIKNSEIVFLTDNLEYAWHKHEEKLCYVVNHKSIQEIGIEISKIRTYLEKGDEKEFFASLNLISLYANQYRHFMGASIHNLL